MSLLVKHSLLSLSINPLSSCCKNTVKLLVGHKNKIVLTSQISTTKINFISPLTNFSFALCLSSLQASPYNAIKGMFLLLKCISKKLLINKVKFYNQIAF